MSNYFCFQNKFINLNLITMISIETAKIIQSITKTIEATGRTIPLESIFFEILKFKQVIHLAEVHEDIKDGSKIIPCEITKYKNRKNAEQLMNGILRHHQWKRKMLDWYQFRTKWYCEGASRFLRSRMSITPSLQLERNGRTLKHSKYYSHKK